MSLHVFPPGYLGGKKGSAQRKSKFKRCQELRKIEVVDQDATEKDDRTVEVVNQEIVSISKVTGTQHIEIPCMALQRTDKQKAPPL